MRRFGTALVIFGLFCVLSALYTIATGRATLRKGGFAHEQLSRSRAWAEGLLGIVLGLLCLGIAWKWGATL